MTRQARALHRGLLSVLIAVVDQLTAGCAAGESVFMRAAQGHQRRQDLDQAVA